MLEGGISYTNKESDEIDTSFCLIALWVRNLESSVSADFKVGTLF